MKTYVVGTREDRSREFHGSVPGPLWWGVYDAEGPEDAVLKALESAKVSSVRSDAFMAFEVTAVDIVPTAKVVSA